MKQHTMRGPVRRNLVGDNGPSVRPGDDPELYGSAVLKPLKAVEVRSFQTFTVTYTVGRIGIDDTGAIRVCFRMVCDAGKPQTHDPRGENYVTANCSGGGTIVLRVAPEGQRPWNLAVTAELQGGYLSEGETITLVFGDTSHGSPGMLLQTFAEEGYEILVSTDVQATGNFLPLDQQFSVPVVAGPAAKWVAVLPTLRRPGERFRLGLKAEDAWGNPTSKAKGHVRLEPSLPVTGLPAEFDYEPHDRAMAFEDLSVEEPGILRIKVFIDDRLAAEAGPLVIEDGPVAGWWGDLHGQTGETVGVNTIEYYFDFARNKAFLDVAAHQGNDFQINARLLGTSQRGDGADGTNRAGSPPSPDTSGPATRRSAATITCFSRPRAGRSGAARMRCLEERARVVVRCQHAHRSLRSTEGRGLCRLCPCRRPLCRHPL